MTTMRNNKIVKRTYIQIEGELASPLLIGSGENIRTDMDVIRDYKGNPFIPGTACAGAFRQWLSSPDKKDDVASLFGADKENEADFRQSRLFVSDVIFSSAKIHVREHVYLEHKVVKDTGKFDVEVVETGAPFTMFLEYIERGNSTGEDEKLLQEIIRALYTGELKLGGKTSRGYGKVSITKVAKKVFDYTTKEAVQEWLNWTWEEGNMAVIPVSAFGKMEPFFETITLPLSVKQTLLIRDYKAEGGLDYTYLKSNGQAVIPGTTWAGAFRQRLQDILESFAEKEGTKLGNIVSDLFGSKLDNNQGTPSILQFEESTIYNYTKLTRTRNAIDRFSGATIDGALFTGKSVCKGDTELIIRWRKTSSISDKVIRGILYWLVQDLHHGFLAIGGETAVGRGVFELKNENQLDSYKQHCQKAMNFCLRRLDEDES